MHSLGIVQWNSTRRDHPGNPGGVSGSGPVTHVSQTRFMTPDTRCLEKCEIPTVSKFDVVARFRDMIPTVKSVSSSEI